MQKERRAAENAALRELVNALKEFIAARDALWTLGFFDRIFHFSRCITVLNRYDQAQERVRSALQDVRRASMPESPPRRGLVAEKASPSSAPRLSEEELEMLLGKSASAKPSPPNASPLR